MSNEKKVRVAALQTSFGESIDENVKRVTEMIREAHGRGAQIILPSELFEGPYFPKEEREEHFLRARPAEGHPTLLRFQKLAAELGVAIPVSFFERDVNAFYNSLAMVDADGKILGVYRKSHIPDGPGYEEKYYFRPGNTGFKVWDTRFGRIGVGICWDQWFPECARAMTLMGAEILFYPTAIGSEPANPELDTRAPWQRAMIGHAVSNAVPVVTANRIGSENGQVFYGHSFVADHRGDILVELSRNDSGLIVTELDIEASRLYRASFGFFRDRRPDLYGPLLS